MESVDAHTGAVWSICIAPDMVTMATFLKATDVTKNTWWDKIDVSRESNYATILKCV